ncbi:hypothetical protein D915_009589 [Fasciola hepatica]|uniref:Uncharacterized protein n=1 Tax=Fasciola hepatica TaxID=6192 RepID=A0A2H1BVL8_FASHE|nr:hypothetical protein D915_009589 [Fasciola hepatica]
MVWLIKRRDEVRPICPLRGCFCLDNRMGCFICTIFTALTAFLSWIFVVLDLISWGVPEFQVDHRFPTYWRIRFWKGFVLCDIVMFFANLILLIMSVIVIVAIVWPARYRLYHLKPYLRAWCIIMVLYLITNLGVGVYTYSWYGLSAWRAPYLIFSEMYYIICYVLHVWFLVIGFSYYSEVRMTLFGEGDPEVLQEVGFLSTTPSAISPHIYTNPNAPH